MADPSQTAPARPTRSLSPLSRAAFIILLARLSGEDPSSLRLAFLALATPTPPSVTGAITAPQVDVDTHAALQSPVLPPLSESESTLIRARVPAKDPRADRYGLLRFT